MRARAWAGELARDEMSSWRDAAMGSSQEALAGDASRKPLKLSSPDAWLAQQAAKQSR